MSEPVGMRARQEKAKEKEKKEVLRHCGRESRE